MDLYIDIGIDRNVHIFILQERQYEVLFVCKIWYATHWKTGYYLFFLNVFECLWSISLVSGAVTQVLCSYTVAIETLLLMDSKLENS